MGSGQQGFEVTGEGWSTEEEDAKAVRLRVYLDCFEGSVPVWQVDNGPGTLAMKVSEVAIRGAHGVTKHNLNADSLSEPKCWLEYDGEVSIHQGIALIRRKHG
jgi:hypothetical protein